MSIATIPIKDCFASPEEGERVVPNFHFLDIEDDSPFRLIRLQCKEDLKANQYEGVQHTTNDHMDKCRDAMRLAHTERADLFLTPEYCIPLSLIDEIISNPELRPRTNKLWCLGCEGVSYDKFNEYINSWGDQAIVGKRTLEDIRENHFVNFLLYVFISKEDGRLCLVPQLKVQRMSEPILVCEGSGLTIGSKIIVFGKETENQLFTLLCADAFSPEIKSGHLFFPDRQPKRYIILHPQLNPSPRHPDMAALRNHAFDNTSGKDVIYITANWAYGTTISTGEGSTLSIEIPWSSIYRRFLSYDGERNWKDVLREVRIKNYKYGLGLGFHRTRKYKVWFANKTEHIQQLKLSKPFDGGAELASPLGKVQAEKAYFLNPSRNGWQEGEIPFQEDLPTTLLTEVTQEYIYPLTASVEDRDKFFGYCLGNMKSGQLYISDQESSGRISYHIDKQCEPEREHRAELIVKLIQCLKSKEELPGQLRGLGDNFRFQLAQRTPFNLIPQRGNENQGALAVYEERANSMKHKFEQIYESLGDSAGFMDDKICVFSHEHTGRKVYYPKYSEEYTSPVKTHHSTDFTEGGALIDPEMD
ncbi:hypothetical protein QF028_004813 [Neobacillus sp. B4I6]|uniref:hypothetical protein n=1 Tax=Neobacillus sp. B4I6 TaxID=3373925 RepID=UPI003D1D7081